MSVDFVTCQLVPAGVVGGLQHLVLGSSGYKACDLILFQHAGELTEQCASIAAISASVLACEGGWTQRSKPIQH